MLRFEYCLARAERLRMLMLTASDPASAVRLRGFVQKYRDLAERAKKQIESPPLNPVGIEYGLSYAPHNTLSGLTLPLGLASIPSQRSKRRVLNRSGRRGSGECIRAAMSSRQSTHQAPNAG
jgi:hypothetical protein